MELGILTLLPSVVIIVMAVITKKTTSALLTGVLLCCILQNGTDFIQAFIDLIYKVGASADTAWIVAITALFGCFIELLSISGGGKAFIAFLGKFATSAKRTVVISWIVGVIVAFDDFTSVVIRGTMTKLYDKNKIPRAMLSYITDATASPLCVLVPFGTWAVFYQSLFRGFEEVNALGAITDTYIKAIPFVFYGWISVILALAVATGVVKPLGSMKKAYIRAEKTGKLYGRESARLNEADSEDDGELSRKELVRGMIGYVIPISALIIISITTGDVLTAILITIGIMLILYPLLRMATWKKMMEASMKGVENMASMIVIVFAAYMMKESITAIGMPDYIISVVEPIISVKLLPILTFLVCVIVTFSTGSSWGATAGIAVIVIPLAGALGADIPLILGAILSGGAFGGHICFYTDVTVLTSTLTKIDNYEHAITQFPYGLIGMAVSAVLYLIAGCVII